MTRQECERLLTEKAEEIIKIYREYSPEGPSLTMHVNFDTRQFIDSAGELQTLTPMLSIYSSFVDLHRPIRVLKDVKKGE